MENLYLSLDRQLQVEELQDRLEMMRTIEERSNEERLRIARENMKVYIPLAEELGLSRVQNELQELTIKYGFPDDYKVLKQKLMEAEDKCEAVFQTFKFPICALLDGLGIDYDFIYRMKSVYSIWRKMRIDGKAFDEIYDLFATRIIYRPHEKVEPLERIGYTNYSLDPKPLPLDIFDPEILECWRIYTAITSIYHVQPSRIKDWINHPKPSGYQALQMTCMGPDGTWVEVQIRSERMNHEAEYGNAAHWKYKAKL